MEDEKFDSWAILELMGHRRLAGRVRETTLAGVGVLRIDIPAAEGQPASTQFYPPGSMYALTPVSEEIARGLAERGRHEPVSVYELPERLQPARTTPVVEDRDQEEPDDGF